MSILALVAVKAMLRLVLEAHTCNASTYFSLPSGVFVDQNKTIKKAKLKLLSQNFWPVSP